MSYGYNLAGAMISETYPSGRVVSTVYNNSGRVSQVSGQKAGEAVKTYASSFNYTAHGAVKELKLGNNLWEHTSFNTRLQPTEIALGTSTTDSSKLHLAYAYGTTANNGNVLSQTITISGGPTLSQTYSYDSLNRLDTATESNASVQTWKQRFSYDRFGNRTFNQAETSQNVLGANHTISTTNNRINATGYSYDNAGNLLNDPNHSYSYDAENRMVSNDGGANQYSGVAASYSYDGDGR
jgi:YD repeat-containing protein